MGQSPSTHTCLLMCASPYMLPHMEHMEHTGVGTLLSMHCGMQLLVRLAHTAVPCGKTCMHWPTLHAMPPLAGVALQGTCLPHVDCYPQPIMKWTETFYQHAFGRYGDFGLRENGE